jgi:hypothetical protein
LSPHDGIANRHQWLAEVEVSGDYPTAVIDVNDVSSQKEIVDERHNATVRRAHRLTDSAPEIDAEVATGHATVEQAPGSEFAGDY